MVWHMNTIDIEHNDVGVTFYELRVWLLTRTAMALAAVMEGIVRSLDVYDQ